MSDIFIAHVEEDVDVALEIALGLEEAGYTTWCYEVDSIPGPSYLIQTGKAVEESKVVIVVVSPHSLSSRQVTREVVRAHESGAEFIPVLRGITHLEFQNRQPEWREAIGAAASIKIPREGAARIISRIIDGLKILGILPKSKIDATRIAQIRKTLGELQGRGILDEVAEPVVPTRKPKPEDIAAEVTPAKTAEKAKRRQKWIRLGLIASAIIVLGVVGLILFSQPEESPAPPTSEVQSPPTAPEPPAEETPVPSPSLLYEDDFSNPHSGWLQESLEDREAIYKDGEYHILVKKYDWVVYAWNRNAGPFTDFALEIDARLVSGPEGSCYGVIFRIQHTLAENYYRFLVSGDGYYLIGARTNEAWTELRGWTKSDFIETGNSTNHLKVICEGSQIEVYVNGHYLATVTDDFLTEGCVGVIVDTHEPDTHVAFDNISVYSLD